ncbi:MAG: magnesium-translocating P-type ATPase [Sphaerobacter sp.]|nr:magnesium-translocating P-type ATPase [Sphaerobacter sp.]
MRAMLKRADPTDTAPGSPSGAAFWDIPLPTLLEQLHTSPAGLTEIEAARRLRVIGPNDVTGQQRTGPLAESLRYFLSPLVAILLLASAAAAVLGERVNSAIIATIVLLSAALNILQSYRSQRAVSSLQRMVRAHATVLRDGRWVEVAPSTLVPGDVVRLSIGDLVPADCRLLETDDLSVNQAALTGESTPAAKVAGELGPGVHGLVDATNAVFLGSSVSSGAGTAVVVRTGRATAYGGIARRLAARPPETEFERGLRQFSHLIARTVLFLVLFVSLANTLHSRPPLESLLFAVALAVGLTPEFLPMIVAVTLASGARRMTQRKVIVRHLPAIENFGSMDILCSDKTGTLTEGVMTLTAAVDAAGRDAPEVRQLAALNSRFQSGINSPFDAAILQAAPEPVPATGARKVAEIPFDFARRRLSVIVEADGRRLLISKGAPESLLAVCRTYRTAGETRPLDPASCDLIARTVDGFGRDGLRCLAVAVAQVPAQARYGIEDERDLTLVGFVAFADPPRADARAAIAALQADGVAIKVLTGDNEHVAARVCQSVGLPPGRIVLGSELDRMTDAALSAVADEVTLFARVSPEQKHRILLALKRRGHVVGFLGDGINDAPSLHSADVGISVDNAADIAREAAEIVLLERGLGVLHTGVMEGRRAFANVMKYVMMGTSSNFGNMLSMAAAAVVLPFLPLLPTQVLLNNFLYDLAQVAISTDRVDAAALRHPERWDGRAIRDFMLLMGPLSSVFDFLTFGALLRLFHATEPAFHTGWFIESVASQTLIIFVIRTAGNPLRSRPSAALVATVVAVVTATLLLPFTPLADPLGFVRPSPPLLLFITGVVASYLLLAELTKRIFYRRRARARRGTPRYGTGEQPGAGAGAEGTRR